MTDQPDAAPADTDAGFDANRLGSIATMRRTRDDRMVAGVCAGAARYLNVDPVVLRVIVASLSFVGLAGLIIYVAAWLLIPEEGEEAGLVDGMLPGTVDREQVRRLGLFVATAIAAASALGAGFAFDWPAIPLVLAVLVGFYLVVVRPYNRRQREAGPRTDPAGGATTDTTAGTAAAVAQGGPVGANDTTAPTPPGAAPPLDLEPAAEREPRNPRRDHWALLGLTTAVAVIVLGAMGLYSTNVESVAWPYYPFAAFVVYGVGMVVGGFVGNGRPLALFGVPLAVVLLSATVLPTYTVGRDANYPVYASDVESRYEQGVGDFVLDLSEVRDPGSLAGRTVTVEQGVGGIEVVVPDGIDVDVVAESDAGELKIFGETYGGAPVTRHHADPLSDDPDLHLDLSQTTGQIRVTRS